MRRIRFIRSFVTFRWDGWRPRIVLLERFEPQVKWTLRSITLIGLISGLVALPATYGFLTTIVLMAFEQLLERAVFVYTSAYIQALPEFRYDPDKWPSMAFLFNGLGPNGVGFVFTDRDYAAGMFRMFKAWNHRSDEDREDNIKLSFIIEDDHYWVYMYGNPRKKQIQEFFRTVESETRLEKYGKEHRGLVAGVTLCRAFAIGPSCGLGKFVTEQKRGDLFLLVALLQGGDGACTVISEVAPIKKWHFKVRHSHELRESDDEWNHWRYAVKG